MALHPETHTPVCGTQSSPCVHHPPQAPSSWHGRWHSLNSQPALGTRGVVQAPLQPAQDSILYSYIKFPTIKYTTDAEQAVPGCWVPHPPGSTPQGEPKSQQGQCWSISLNPKPWADPALPRWLTSEQGLLCLLLFPAGKKKITTKILPGHGHETAEWRQAFSQPQAAAGAAFTLSRSAEACARLLWFKRLQLHPWCFSGPHLIPRNRELKEFVEFLWLLACLQWSGALAEGSPNSPTPALVWLG